MLAYCTAAYWSFTGAQEDHINALRYSTSSITGMRKCLASAKKHPKFDVEELVYRLLRAEILVNNPSAARIHIGYLQQLLKSKAEAGALNPEQLTLLMNKDNNLALNMTLKPILESSWVLRVFAQSWNQANLLFPNPPSFMLY